MLAHKGIILEVSCIKNNGVKWTRKRKFSALSDAKLRIRFICLLPHLATKGWITVIIHSTGIIFREEHEFSQESLVICQDSIERSLISNVQSLAVIGPFSEIFPPYPPPLPPYLYWT